MKSLTLLLLMASAAAAQVTSVAQKTTALSEAAEVITVQQPAASAGRLVKFVAAYADCSVACTITLERNGTPATGTALTPVNVNPGELTPVTKAYYSSDVGTGTVLMVVSITAGGSVVFDLSRIQLPARSSTSNNLTLRTSSITGTVHIAVQFTEE